MIKDKLSNCKNYKNLDLKIVEGLDILSKSDWKNIPDGKIVFSDDLYMNVQSYTTKSDAYFEAHKVYVDIQYIISGTEYIGVTSYNECLEVIPYDKQKDIEFLSGTGEFIPIEEGEFMILYPEDAHKPSISIDKHNPSAVRKAVVKVKL